MVTMYRKNEVGYTPAEADAFLRDLLRHLVQSHEEYGHSRNEFKLSLAKAQAVVLALMAEGAHAARDSEEVANILRRLAPGSSRSAFVDAQGLAVMYDRARRPRPAESVSHA